MGDHIILKTDTDVTLMANGIKKGTKDLIKDVADLKKGLDKLNGKEVTLTVKGEVDMSEVDAAKKEVAKPVETPVKLKLDASEIKALQNLPTAKAKVEFLINKKAVNDIVAKDLNGVIDKAAKKMNSKLQGITSESMASLASLDKFLPNIPELSSSKHRAMMTELKKKGLSDISQNERAQIESAYRLRSYLLDSKKEMSERGKFIPPSESLVAPDASLSLEDYNKALNGLIKTSKNIIIASDLFGQLNKQLETNGRNIPVEQDVSSKTMRRLLGMGIKKNDPDYDPNNYAQYLLNQSLNKAGFSDDIDKIVAHQTHKIEFGVTSSNLDTIFKKSQNEGLSKKDYSELVNRYINKSLAELEKDILSDDQFGEIALGSISDIKKKAETLNDSLKTRRKNKFIGLMSTYLAKGGSGINNEEFYKALLSDISEYDKDIDAEGKQKAIEQAVQKQLTEQKAAENKEEKSAPKKTTRKRTVKKKESIPVQTDVEEEDASPSTPPTPPKGPKDKTTREKIEQADRKGQSLEEVSKPKIPETPISPKYKVVSAPKLAPVKNNDVIDETKNTADAINQSADAVIEAKKKESDAVVNSNDKIAKSEEKVAIKTVSGLKNSNSNLTETPVTPPELDGLKQLSQREFGDAQKYIKVYEDTNRTIYTLTQTYKKQFDANGNLLAEGYENAIAYYDSYEKLEGEAVKLSKKINSNYAKLDTEKYKSTDKQNPNLLKKLQDDIKSDQQDLSEIHRIARLNASLPDNDYMYQNFTQALRKGSAESARSLSATRKTNRDNFNVKKDTLNTDISKQISDIESLGQAGTIAAGKLQGIQKSLSTITTPAGLENVQKQITDINEQFDSNKARESALNYVHNLEQGLTGKQNVVIGTKNASDNFVDSINKVNGTWTGPLANLDKTFKFNRNTTATEIDGYIADAKKLGDIGKASAEAFSNLKTNLESCYTESGLKQIQTQMRGISKEMSTAKKQADEAAKNSETAKINDQYTQIMSDMSNLEKKNKELRTALKSDKNSDYIKNITAERDAYKEAVKGADEYIEKHKEVIGDKNVKKYNTAKSRVGQAETDIENDIAAQTKAIDTKDFTDRYTSAIADVKALGEAYKELSSIQKEAFSKKSGQSATTLDDYNQRITAAQNKIKTLTTKVQDFRDNVWGSDAAQADKLNQKVFDNYEKQFDNMSNTKDNYTADLVEAMKTAYQLKRSTEASLLKKSMNVSLDSGQSAELKGKSSYASQLYGSLRDQVIEQFGKDFQEQAISDLRTTANSQRSDILNTNFKTLSDDIGQYVSSVTKAGRASKQFESDFSGISTDLVNLQNTFSNPSKLNSQGIAEYFDQMNAIAKNYESLKQHYSSGVGKISLDYEQALGAISGEKSVGKNSNYLRAAQSYIEEYNGIWSKYNEDVKQFAEGSAERQQLTAQAEKDSTETIKKMQNLAKNASKYEKVTNKGTEIDWTANRTKNTKDASAFLSQYASSIGLTSEISTKINESTGQVTKTFTDISGNTVTLTGNIDKFNDSLRVTQSLVSKSGSGMSSFGNSIKGLVSGNFKGAIADIASYVSYFQVTMKAIQQAKQGFNDFLNFQKDLTNVSYTMNLSPDQLQNLGTSAIDMAKDLSMSLDNTMDIYKIYANMNTTASEIQQTARPTAILSNLSGVDASTAADQVQGILQQFHMLEDGSTTAADASMHIVDVLDKVSGSVGIDYAKGIKIISDAVQASGQVAYDAGMSYEQLAAITAKVSERTREDGSSIGNALKTIITRTTKVGKMPQYADEVDNATLSNASASLHAVGVDVYNPDGSDRGIITVMSELKDKWDDLTDAQQAKIAFDVAATRQTSKFKSILDAFTDSMSLAEEATTANGNAEANQEKYMESTAGKLQAIKTQMQDFWVNFYNSGTVNGVLEFIHSLTEGFTSLEKTLGPIPALLTAVFAAMTVKNATMAGLKFLSGEGLATVVG